MRARTLVSLVSVGSLVFLGLAVGCGDTTETTAATTDSGLDAPKGSEASSNADTGPEDCVDADITKLTIPDASFGDGGVNTAECSSCLKTNCSGNLDNCQADCQCREGVLKFFSCVGSGKALQACAGGLVSAGQSGQELGLCAIQSGCDVKCGVPKDGGSTNNDAASDAPSDG